MTSSSRIITKWCDLLVSDFVKQYFNHQNVNKFMKDKTSNFLNYKENYNNKISTFIFLGDFYYLFPKNIWIYITKLLRQIQIETIFSAAVFKVVFLLRWHNISYLK